jgi:hypothetical protein
MTSARHTDTTLSVMCPFQSQGYPVHHVLEGQMKPQSG